MSDNKIRKSEQLAVRVTAPVKAAAEKAAHDELRPVSGLIERLLIEYLRREGYLDEGAR